VIPATYDIEMYRGDTYHGPLIRLPDLSAFGGPHDLTAATVTADIRTAFVGQTNTLVTSFEVEMLDAAARELRLHLDAAVTGLITQATAIWDLSVAQGDWRGTPLAGRITFSGQVTP
jgi:hypothetical protein